MNKRKLTLLILAIVCIASCLLSMIACKKIPTENAPLMTGISIKTTATKTDYEIGEELDLSGLVIQGDYDDDTSVQLSSNEYEISTPFDKDTSGEYTVVVTYLANTAFTVSFTVRVLAPSVVEALSVKEDSIKNTVYALSDQRADLDGLIITIKYVEGNSEEVTGEDISRRFTIENTFRSAGECVISFVLRTDTTKSCSFTVTVYDTTTLSPDELRLSSKGTLTYLLNATFRNDFELEAKYSELGDRWFTVTAYNHDEIDLSEAGEKTITIYAVVIDESGSSTRIEDVFVSYNINVIDNTGYQLTGIRVAADSSHSVRFYMYEAFSYVGLKIEKVNTKQDAEDIIIMAEDSEISVDSQGYIGDTAGQYSIRVYLNEDENISTTYSVEVLEYDLRGRYAECLQIDYEDDSKVLYGLKYEINAPDEIYIYTNGVRSQEAVYITTSTRYVIDGTVTVLLRLSNNSVITYYPETDTISYCISIADDAVLLHVVGNNILLQESYVVLMATGGRVSKEQLDVISLLGNLYLDEAGNTPLTDSTVITEAITVYSIFVQDDYRDMPFLGTFVLLDRAGDIIEIGPIVTATGLWLYGTTFEYAVNQVGNNWEIVVMGQSFPYDSTNDTISIIDNVFVRIPDTYCIVNVTSTIAEYGSYCGYFPVRKGEAFQNTASNFLVSYSTKEGAAYNGEAIFEDTQFTVKDVSDLSDYLSQQISETEGYEKYGTYEFYFEFTNVYNISVYDTKQLKIYLCEYTYDKAEEGRHYVTITSRTAGEDNFELEGYFSMVDGVKCLTVSSGEYQGEYLLGDDFYSDMPFIGSYLGNSNMSDETSQSAVAVEIRVTVNEDSSGTIAVVNKENSNPICSNTLIVKNVYSAEDGGYSLELHLDNDTYGTLRYTANAIILDIYYMYISNLTLTKQ